MRRIVILGGSGFLGRSLCKQIVEHFQGGGPRLAVPTRRPSRARHLTVLPTVDVMDASVHDDMSLTRVLRDADAVVNLIAILHGSASEFERVHVGLPQRLIQACSKVGVRRLVHVSALGVPQDPAEAPSHYLRSKAMGEQALRAAVPAGLALTVLRPSVMFGEHDRFLNLFAKLQRVFPVMPLAGADARFQPVWVEDVAAAIVRCLIDADTIGQTYECVGPDVFTLRDLVRLAGQASGHPRPVLGLPAGLARAQAALMALMPGEPLMSKDNLKSMQVPNVASGQYPGLTELGIAPSAVTTLAPTWLAGGPASAERLDAFRRGSRRR